MKLISALASMLLLCVSVVHAQTDEESQGGDGKRLFVKVFGSYSLSTPGSFKAPASQRTIRREGTTTSSFNDQKKGLGAGFRVGAGLGIIINEYINIGIDGEYLSGNKFKSNSVSEIYGTVIFNDAKENLPDTTLASGSYELSHSLLSIVPHITFKAISTNDYYIYTRVGVIVGIPMEIKVNETGKSVHKTVIPKTIPITQPFNYYTEINSSSVHKYKSNPGIGYQAALGIQFRISDNLRFYSEVVSNSLILHPEEYEETDNTTIKTTRTTTNGQPGPNVIKTDHSRAIQRFTNNSSSGTSTSGTPGNYVYYFQSSKISIPVNSLNIGVGLAYRF